MRVRGIAMQTTVLTESHFERPVEAVYPFLGGAHNTNPLKPESKELTES